MAITPFRVRIKDLSAPWLRDGTGERLMWTFGTMVDARMEKVLQGTNAGMPTRAQPDALTQLGVDVLISQGPNESTTAYARRVQRAFETWQLAGSPFALLGQLAAFLAPSPPPLRIVTDSGHWYTLEAGVFSVLPPDARPPATASNWIWDANTGTYWPRFWVIIDCTGGPYTQTQVYGDGSTYGDGHLWGATDIVAGDIIGIQQLIALWKPAHATCTNIILDFTGHFQPTGSGAGYPNGTWNYWANRWQPAAYIPGA